jgi:hypothetical protein
MILSRVPAVRSVRRWLPLWHPGLHPRHGPSSPTVRRYGAASTILSPSLGSSHSPQTTRQLQGRCRDVQGAATMSRDFAAAPQTMPRYLETTPRPLQMMPRLSGRLRCLGKIRRVVTGSVAMRRDFATIPAESTRNLQISSRCPWRRREIERFCCDVFSGGAMSWKLLAKFVDLPRCLAKLECCRPTSILPQVYRRDPVRGETWVPAFAAKPGKSDRRRGTLPRRLEIRARVALLQTAVRL